MSQTPNTFKPVYARTYARYVEEDGRRETWFEVVKRAVDGIDHLIPGDMDPVQRAKMFNYIMQLKAFPAGRWLWVGGTDWVMQEKNHLGAFNCININITELQDFATLFDLCCQGCGTGAVLEWSNLSQLPPMKNKLNVEVIPHARQNIGAFNHIHAPEQTRIEYTSGGKSIHIRIGDSREGWAHGILTLLELAAYGGASEYDVTIDLNYVRPSGSLIRGFGGITNPERLPAMYSRIAEIISGAAEEGRRLTPEECCLVIDEGAEAVVAGNVRRSAGMRQFDASHPNIKLNLYHVDEDGNYSVDPKRQPLRMANHTKVYHQLPSKQEVEDSVRLQFRTGEGAFEYAPAAIARANRDLLPTSIDRYEFIARYEKSQQEAAQMLIDRSDEISSEELDHRIKRYAHNPCTLGSSRLLTPEGYRKIEDLVGSTVIINKDGVAVNSRVWCSGTKDVYKLTLTNHQKLYFTADHVFMTVNGKELQAKDLKGEQLQPFLELPVHSTDDIKAGFVQGDDELADLPSNFDEKSKAEKAGFLCGLYSANGSVISRTRVALKSTCKQLIEQVQKTLLEDFGINSYYTVNKERVQEFSNGQYTMRESYDLNIAEFASLQEFHNSIGFYQTYKQEALMQTIKRKAPRVRSIKYYSTELVYDFSEPLTNWGVAEGFVVHNCAEIIGHNFACNLSEVQLAQIDPHNHTEQYEAFEVSTLAACANLHFHFNVPKLERSRQMDPIIGVGFTGLFDFFVRAFGKDWLEWVLEGRPHGGRREYYLPLEQDYLEEWNHVVNRVVDNYCEAHGVKRPNRVTTVKPSGTLSQLSGSSPGWHPSKAAHFIRRVTFAAGDPVANACRRYGYRVVPSQKCTDENGQLLNDPDDPRVDEWLVEIPVKAPWTQYVDGDADELDTQEVPAVAQFDLAMQVQTYYCEHNTSSTIEYDEEEIEPLAEQIYSAARNGEYVSVALMQRARANQLKHTFPRLPYEPITKEQYEELQQEINEDLDFEVLLQEEMKKLSKEEANQDVGESGCSKEGCSILPE